MERRTTDIVIRDKNQGLNQELLCSNEHRRTPLNTETLVVDLGWKERRLTEAEGGAERHRVFLVRSGWCNDRRWGRRRGLTAAAELEALGRREEDDEAKRHERGKEKMTPGPIYKANGYVTATRIEAPKKWISDRAVASIFAGSLIKGKYIQVLISMWCHGGLLQSWKMTSWRFIKFIWRRRHGGLQGSYEDVQGVFPKCWRLTWTGSNQSGA